MPFRYALDVDDGANAGPPRVAGGRRRGGGVVAVDQQHATGAHGGRGDVVGPQLEPRIAGPEHRSLAGPLVDEDHRHPVPRIGGHAARTDVDPFVGEARPSPPAVLVVAEAADVPGAPAEPRARHHGARRLAARRVRLPPDRLLGVGLRKALEHDQQVGHVEAEPDHVEGTAVCWREPERHPHGRIVHPAPDRSRIFPRTMSTMKVTLSIDDRIVAEARRIAAGRGISLDQLACDLLNELTRLDEMETVVAQLDALWDEEDYRSEGRWTREELRRLRAGRDGSLR